MATFLKGFLNQVEDWFHHGHRFAIARVVESVGSSPLPIGAAMVVGPKGEALGSVSGGCVEGAVYQAALEILGGAAPRIEQYGYSDADAFAVGLTCGGTVTVLIEAVDRASFPRFDRVLSNVRQGSPVSWATGPITTTGAEVYRIVLPDANPAPGTFGDAKLDVEVTGLLESSMRTDTSGLHRIVGVGPDSTRDDGSANLDIFIHIVSGPPRLIVVGASSHAAALATLGRALGYHITVCDARPIFATDERFPDSHEVVREWPDRYLANTHIDTRTAICILTHDARFDVPAVVAALASPAGYLGVMGSRKTHNDRIQRLRKAGVTAEQMRRVRSPIGLDLGGRSADETALSILAEIVALRNGRTGLPLAMASGALH
ncbi:XdhC/CoxI family protein [Rhodococcus sp. IEGM 1366]|uniref:XdhC family protein n=1 Tax=Rhodococcus sp. IEGM 1366 TaxID=3082223 RepID=UPI002953D16C|nr:XdhC/CoxI family protein [Rhodococcus sp. IEGM 1366]MDV8071343.1 XdhC/CoxI family protein [Rhodococcus sp. IEGM 1366]